MKRQERKDEGPEPDPNLLEAWEQEDDLMIGGRLLIVIRTMIICMYIKIYKNSFIFII